MLHYPLIWSELLSAITSVVTKTPRTINQILLRKADKILRLQEIINNSDSNAILLVKHEGLTMVESVVKNNLWWITRQENPKVNCVYKFCFDSLGVLRVNWIYLPWEIMHLQLFRWRQNSNTNHTLLDLSQGSLLLKSTQTATLIYLSEIQCQHKEFQSTSVNSLRNERAMRI